MLHGLLQCDEVLWLAPIGAQGKNGTCGVANFGRGRTAEAAASGGARRWQWWRNRGWKTGHGDRLYVFLKEEDELQEKDSSCMPCAASSCVASAGTRKELGGKQLGGEQAVAPCCQLDF